MRIGRAIIIPVILTLGVAGASLTGVAASAAAVHMSNVHSSEHVYVAGPQVYFHS
jgi:hypothetical protein